MPSLRQMLSQLSSTAVGTNTTKIDSDLDSAIKDIASYRSKSGRNSYVELIKSLISKNADINVQSDGGIFSQVPSPSSFGQGGRLKRYKSYEAIVEYINYCQRALNVLVDNILSPDDITKISLNITPKSYIDNEGTSESNVNYIRDIAKRLKIENKLNLLIKSTLLYGDFFIEIGDDKTSLTSKSILTEIDYFENKEILNSRNNDKDTFYEDLGGDKKLNISIDYQFFNEDDKKDNDEREEIKLENIKVIFHEPKYVVKLQSSLYPICFGYLVFPQMNFTSEAMIRDESINNICSKILKSIYNKIPQINELKDDNNLKDIVSYMIRHTNISKSMNIRFIPPNKMVHFSIPSTKYYPYGESIFDSCVYSAKVLIAMETALAIARISRSTEKRKIGIELGLPRDAKRAIDNLRENLKKRKISLDGLGSVDTIPSQISTFEDIYVPTKGGKEFVTIDTFGAGMIDTRSKVDEIKFIRDQLVASLGVPPALIGIEENAVVKATLGEENILFARTIIGHQKYLIHSIQSIFEKIIDIINPEDSLTIMDSVNVSLPSPKNLQIERESKYLQDTVNLIESLERIGVPKEYSKKKYLTNIDWKEVENYITDDKMEKVLDKKKDEGNDPMGGLGGSNLSGGY